MPGERGGPKGIDWDGVRKSYGEGLSVATLSRQFGVAERTIWARKESDAKRGVIWLRPGRGADDNGPEVPEAPRPVTNVIRLPRRGDEATIVGEYVEPDEHVTIEMVLAMQPRVAMGMMRLADRMLRKFNNNEILPGQNQSEADVAERISSTVQRAVELGRTIGGVKDGTPSIIERTEDDGRLVIEHQVIEPKMLPVDQKGRHTA
jgi:hypothetical protein